MSLLINKERVSQHGHSIADTAEKNGFGRIVSGMKVSTSQSGSVGLDRFMRDLSVLFNQGPAQSFGVADSAR